MHSKRYIPDIVKHADPQSDNPIISVSLFHTRDDEIMCCHNQYIMSHNVYSVPYISVIGLKVG